MVDVCSPKARASRKFGIPDVFGEQEVTHKVMALGYQWGISSEPDPAKVCDHPGCMRPHVVAEACVLPCGHSYHRTCAQIVQRPARAEVSIDQLTGDNIYVDRIHLSDESMVCAICEEGLTYSTFLLGRKAKELVEDPKDTPEGNDIDDAENTPDDDSKPWTMEQIDDAVTAANNMLRSLLPPQ